MSVERLALEKFGKKNQLIKTIEELGELQSAIARYINNQEIIEYKINLYEEIADCIIMLEQMRLAFVDVDYWLDTKRKLLYDKISKGGQ